MPKKAAKKAPAKKTTASKKAPAKKAAPKSTNTGLNKKYLHNETEDFYAAHPNVKPLIILFLLIATAVFIYLLKMRSAVAMM